MLTASMCMMYACTMFVGSEGSTPQAAKPGCSIDFQVDLIILGWFISLSAFSGLGHGKRNP